MFKVGDYRVWFKHNPNEEVELSEDLHARGVTECFIENENGIGASFGYAFCSSKDNFSRAVGRKVSLTEALKPFSKDWRKAFWEKYFEKMNENRQPV